MLVSTRSALLVLSLAICGCSESFGPEDLEGTWNATTFMFTRPGEAPVNFLAAGGTLTIFISETGITTGSLVVPEAIAGSILSASMAGTATLEGSTVRFIQQADTFVEVISFTLSGRTMSAVSQNSGGTLFTVVLTRQ